MPCSYDGLDYAKTNSSSAPKTFSPVSILCPLWRLVFKKPREKKNNGHNVICFKITRSDRPIGERSTYITPQAMTTYEDRNGSYPWNHSPHPQQNAYDSRLDESSFNAKLDSSNLLDSCMKELEGRGNMNASEPNYVSTNAYRGPALGGGQYRDDPSLTYSPMYSPNVMNGGPYRSDSPYSSRLSVQSSHSNLPYNQRPGPPKNQPYHHDNAPSPAISNDNYAQYPPPNHRTDTNTPTRDHYGMRPPDDYPPSDRGATPTLPYYNHNPELHPQDYRESPGIFNNGHVDGGNHSPYIDNHHPDSRYHGDSFNDPDGRYNSEPYNHPDGRYHGDSFNDPDGRYHGDSFNDPDGRYHGDSFNDPDGRYHGEPYNDAAGHYHDDQPGSSGDPYRSVEPERRLDAYEGDPYGGVDPYRGMEPPRRLEAYEAPTEPYLEPERHLDAYESRPSYAMDNAFQPLSNDGMEAPEREDDDDMVYPQQYAPQRTSPPPSHQQPQLQQSYHDDSFPGSYHNDYPQDDVDNARLRSPDLQDVIEYLSHENDEIKANAAAYLTHLSYMDDDMKAKIRSMNGIRALVNLLGNDFPEVCRHACCALKNLSYGHLNADNKLAIHNERGISSLVRVLRKTSDSEVVDLVTAILWNMSSLKELKMAIIDDALTMLVALILVKYAGWERHKERPSTDYTNVRWTTALLNTTGILRNLSSGDYQARKRLRECEALIPCVVHLVRVSLDQHTNNTDTNSIDNKCVENCACVMRNLSYLCQESEEPDFQRRRPVSSAPKPQSPAKGELRTGCFGGKKKVATKITRNDETSHSQRMTRVPRDMSQLWHCSIVTLYRKLLMDSSNSVTLEAAVGAIQNVAACYWQPSVEFREAVRREKCLPIIVELLAVDSEPVICASITALRNLTANERNMELIGKYAMQPLVTKLPQGMSRNLPRDHIVQATITTLLEVIKKNSNYAVSVLNDRGIERLRFITGSSYLYLEQTINLARKMLAYMWGITELQSQYKNMNLREEHFLVTHTLPRPRNQPMPDQQTPKSTSHETPYGTMSHPQYYSGQGYDDHTLTTQSRPLTKHVGGSHDGEQPSFSGFVNPAHDPDAYNYGPERRGGAGDGRGVHEMSTYAMVDHERARPQPPSGAVALFPPQHDSLDFREPVYAKVNKNKGHHSAYDDNAHDLSQIRLDDDNVVTNADSWV